MQPLNPARAELNNHVAAPLDAILWAVKRGRTHFLVAVVLAFFWVTPALAQASATTFAELASIIKPGQNIIVTDIKGERTSGKVVSLTGAQLEIKRGKLRLTFAEAGVRKIEKDDPDIDGMLIGGGVGILLGLLAVQHPSQGSEGEEAGVAVLCAALGPSVGGWFDNRHHRTLFSSPLPNSPRRVSLFIAPLIDRARMGALATIRF